jgi:stearoyl-CoA desaturase (delta-9 desaturase)
MHPIKDEPMANATPEVGQLQPLNAGFLIITAGLAVILGAWHLMTQPQVVAPFVACVALYLMCGLSITAGYHRLFSHRTYKASTLAKVILAVVGSANWQNSIIEWASDHRRHHRFVDTDNDPYDARRGFWWSHMGWIMFRGRHHGDLSNVKDLVKDPVCDWQHKYYWPISIAFNVGVTVGLGFLTDNVLGMVIWAGLVRVVIVHHTTFFINSWAHMFGDQPYSDQNTAKDSTMLAFFTHGEGYHNYHHAFETDYRNGRMWYHYDPGKWLIAFMSYIGMAWDLRRIPDDMVLRRRFEERRSHLWLQLKEWGEVWDTWKEDMAGVAMETQGALKGHLVTAEATIEEALSELRQTRSAWQKAQRNRLSKAEIRSLNKTMRAAQHTLREALAEWERMIDEYTMTMAPAHA